MSELTYLQAITDGLRQEMQHDERVFVIGEDIGVYGGAFKVTQGLHEEFGDWRVIDAPLSETAIVAGATGAALMGLRPVAEMQFADFVSCAWDHLVTIAAKQHWRVGTPVPITLRLPSGGGFSGGPFHSQNPESSFAHIPGLKCVCPSTPEDAKGLISAAIRDPNPVLFFEHKHLYRRIKGEVPDERYATPIGKARIHQEGTDITVVTWGAMVHTATEAAAELEDLSVEIVDLRTVLPWDKEAVLASVRKTSKVIVLTRTRTRAASAPRSRRRSPRRPSSSSMRRRDASRRPTVPYPLRRCWRRRSSRRSQTWWPAFESWPSPHGDRRRIEVLMPQMGVSVSEGTVTRWLKNVGDTVAVDETLLEISTDKVDTEVPSPGAGVLTEILVQEGETVDVGSVLARIGSAGDAAAPSRRCRHPTPRWSRSKKSRPAAPTPHRRPRPRRPRSPPRRPLRPRTGPQTGRRSSPRSSPASPPSTASTRRRSPAPAAADG